MIKKVDKKNILNIIKPYKNNIKIHTDKQLRILAQGISRFGWRTFIQVSNTNGVIIAGHGRFLAWQKFKDEFPMKTPYIVDDKGCVLNGALETKPFSKAEEKAYRLFDNLVAEAEYDIELKVSELKLLSENNDIELFSLVGGDDINLSELTDEEKSQKKSNLLNTNTLFQYNIVFDSDTQMNEFIEFIKFLKNRYPEKETLGSVFEIFIKNIQHILDELEDEEVEDEE